MKCFSEDIPAVKTATLLGLNRKTIDRYYTIFREKIAIASIADVKRFKGEVELDESYFGAKRVSSKRGRGTAGKTPVLGILKRDGKVFVTIVKKRNCISTSSFLNSNLKAKPWESY